MTVRIAGTALALALPGMLRSLDRVTGREGIASLIP